MQMKYLLKVANRAQEAKLLVTKSQMAFSSKSPLITCQELYSLMQDKNRTPHLTILNGTLRRPDLPPFDDHVNARIPGSVLFDFEKVADTSQAAPYMLPTDDQFIEEMKNIDVRKSDDIVVYDKSNMLSAPRAYWMLKSYGVKNVRVLDGAFKRWESLNLPVENGYDETAFIQLEREDEPKADDYDYKINKRRYLTFEEIVALKAENESNPQTKWIPFFDSRFTKNYDEGHVPTSKTLPFTEVLTPDRAFKSKEELIQVFKNAGVQDPLNDRVVFTCQRGITACILEAAITYLGNDNCQVYDGSYEEWIRRSNQAK